MEEALLVCIGVGGCTCSSCCGALGFLSPSWTACSYKTLSHATRLSLTMGMVPPTRVAPGSALPAGQHVLEHMRLLLHHVSLHAWPVQEHQQVLHAEGDRPLVEAVSGIPGDVFHRQVLPSACVGL